MSVFRFIIISISVAVGESVAERVDLAEWARLFDEQPRIHAHLVEGVTVGR